MGEEEVRRRLRQAEEDGTIPRLTTEQREWLIRIWSTPEGWEPVVVQVPHAAKLILVKQRDKEPVNTPTIWQRARRFLGRSRQASTCSPEELPTGDQGDDHVEV